MNKPKSNGSSRVSGAATRAAIRNQETASRQLNGNGSAVANNRSRFNGAGGRQLNESELRRQVESLRGAPTLKIIPLGGVGEVGKNLNIIEFGADAIVLDAGFILGIDLPGINYAVPELTYLEKIKQKIRGHVFTHGHLDHVGAMPYVLPIAPTPCYGSRLTLDMLERVMSDRNPDAQMDKRIINPDSHEKVQIGPFTIELVRVAHSIPDACAVVIDTPVGRLLHTGDFKLDPTPLDGKKPDLERFAQLGKEGVQILMSDSTNCENPGRTPTEQVVRPALEEVFKRCQGRIIVSAVSTNINRIQMIIDSVAKSGRKVAIDGRSMLANVEMAVRNGFIKIPRGTIVAMRDNAQVKDKDLAIISTGHQGELNSVLMRMASGEHKFIKLKPTDTVVLSASVIPGNEKAVVTVVDRILREGTKVYRHETRELDGTGPLHVSGHARRDELSEMIQMLKPKYFVPIHGEFHHQVRHAELAAENHIAPDNIFVMDKGDVLEVARDKALKTGRVPAGALLVDQNGEMVPGLVIKDRLLMSEDGMVVTVLTIDKPTGQLLTSPDIITRGFIHVTESEELMNELRTELRRFSLRRFGRVDVTRFKQELRDAINAFLYRATQRSPIIIPVVNVVGPADKTKSPRPAPPAGAQRHSGRSGR